MNKARKSIVRNSLFLFFTLLVISNFAFASAIEYDGIWFLGFNLKHDLLKDNRVRQAVASCLDKDYIASGIMSAEVVPNGFIPPRMPGYDADLPAYKKDIAYAKLLMSGANYPISDKRLKKLSLLHTDGIKTVEIARGIQKELKSIGMKVELVEVSYRDEDAWTKELASGRHDFFLMGYKTAFLTEEAQPVDGYSLIAPLFRKDGDANFTGYANAEVDKLLDQVESIDPALKEDRNTKLKAANRILHKELPAVVLFYIEKL